jgi:hypothetical protein
MKDDLYQKYTYEKLKLNQKVHIYVIRNSMRKGGKIKFYETSVECIFYKKYGNTGDSTESTVESSVLQSRNFNLKYHSHHFNISWHIKYYLPEKWTYGTS